MVRYIIRRLFQLIPTVFGVIVITFLLFNVVGGSPAVIKLGKNASPQMLEDFEVVRGLNKPVFLGRWCRTRILTETDFWKGCGRWRETEGVIYEESNHRLLLTPNDKGYLLPLEFGFFTGVIYRIIFEYSTDEKFEGYFYVDEKRFYKLVPSSSKIKETIVFYISQKDKIPYFSIKDGKFYLYSIRMQLKNRNIFDSQFFFFLKQILKFDLGVSYETNQKVSEMIFDGILPSLSLAVPIFIFSQIFSIGLSLICAYFHDKFIDRIFVIISVVLMSVNYLVWIIGGQYLFGYVLGWFPIWGYESIKYLILPVLIGVFTGIGPGVRLYRSIMLEEMSKEYVRTALAKGVSVGGVLLKHVLRNAMIPILTNVIITIPFLYTGNLLLESFFGIPGLGSMSVNALNSADFDVVRALVLIGAIIYVIANLLTDICYALVDPRIRLK